MHAPTWWTFKEYQLTETQIGHILVTIIKTTDRDRIYWKQQFQKGKLVQRTVLNIYSIFITSNPLGLKTTVIVKTQQHECLQNTSPNQNLIQIWMEYTKIHRFKKKNSLETVQAVTPLLSCPHWYLATFKSHEKVSVSAGNYFLGVATWGGAELQCSRMCIKCTDT